MLPHLYADLNRLPVSTLGVWDALGVVLGVIDHRGLVPRLLLQGEDDAPDVHVAAMNRDRRLEAPPTTVDMVTGDSDNVEKPNRAAGLGLFLFKQSEQCVSTRMLT